MVDIKDNKFNVDLAKHIEKDIDVEKEFEKDSQFSKQKQFNKQYNYNWFDQKVIVKQAQGQRADNDADSISGAEATSVAGAEGKDKIR